MASPAQPASTTATPQDCDVLVLRGGPSSSASAGDTLHGGNP